MGERIYRAAEVEAAFGTGTWQAIVHREICANLESTARPFPCVFGVAELKADQLRFAFDDRLDADWLGGVLGAYLKAARSIGRNTSLVVFSRPGPIAGLEAYRARLWVLLRDLARLDPAPWPASVDERLDHPSWEFSFGGEPVFVVCNTPAHVLRQSRRASTFMVTFQPRWVFEEILDGGPGEAKAVSAVRRRLAAYDMLPPSPVLGKYGDPHVREHEQYFLNEGNERPRCPFVTLREDHRRTKPCNEEAA